MLDMTSYEMLDLANTHMSASVDDLSRSLALGSAYLMCAYKAGKELTRLQVSIINVGFIVFVGQAMIGAHAELSAAVLYNQAAWAGEVTPDGPWEAANAVTSGFGIVAIGAILACLAFMWSVRHPKPK